MSQETTEIYLKEEEIASIKKECHAAIKREEALKRLKQNKDFQDVFMTFYLQSESARLVSMLGDQSINMGSNKAKFREDFQELMIGIARFAEFMRNVEAISQQAQNSLKSIEKAENEIYTNE